MLTVEKYLMGRADVSELTPDLRQNAGIFIRRFNKLWPIIEKDTGRAPNLTSGYRRQKDQPSHAAKLSPHLRCEAGDFEDGPDAWLWRWCLRNLRLIAEVGLFLEDPRWTHNVMLPGRAAPVHWMHFQIHPPRSGRRIFQPSSAPPSAPDLWDGDYDPALNIIPRR